MPSALGARLGFRGLGYSEALGVLRLSGVLGFGLSGLVMPIRGTGMVRPSGAGQNLGRAMSLLWDYRFCLTWAPRPWNFENSNGQRPGG